MQRVIWILIVIFVILARFWLSPSASAAVYRWKNAKGQIEYSTTLPSSAVSGHIEVKRNNRWTVYRGQATEPRAPIQYTTSTPGQTDVTPVGNPAQIVVPYEQHQSMIVIPVTLNQQVTEFFAVDTGASYTVISPKLAAQLGLQPQTDAPLMTLQTANGRIDVPLINLQSVTFQQATTPNVMAAIHEVDPSAQIAGLLGLNFLNRFQLTVDTQNAQLILKPLHPATQFSGQDCAAARALSNRGRALHDYSSREVAYYRQAIALCPDLLEAYYYLGEALIQQQNAAQAIAIHRKIVTLQPNDAEAHFRLGVAFLLQREPEQAKKEWQHALRLKPDHQQASEYLQRLSNSAPQSVP